MTKSPGLTMQLSDELYIQISNYIRQNAGLNFPPEKQADLEYGLSRAASEYGVSDLEAFVSVILNRPMTSEIKLTLQKYLTIGETYFFRERPVIDKFRSLLLRLSVDRRKAGKTLKIWSAGCSSGEEPYTIAMTIAEALPDYNSWEISLIGTDINTDALEKARQAVYRAWSFRGMDKPLIDKYFSKYSDTEFRVKDVIRNMVTLQYLNLFEDPYPSPLTKTAALDFIFCRNVIMYFDEAGRKKVLQGFYNSLQRDGHLFLSLTELAHQSEKRFVTHKEGSIIYFQKSIDISTIAPEKRTGTVTYPARPEVNKNDSKIFRIETSAENTYIEKNSPGTRVEDLLEKFQNMFAAGDYNSIISLYEAEDCKESISGLSEPDREKIFEYLLKSFANTGKLAMAESASRSFLLDIKTSAKLHYIYANILQEREKMTDAVLALQKALFLDSQYIPAYFMLANLYRRINKIPESRKSFEVLRELLAKKNGNTLFPDLDNISVNELLSITNTALTKLKDYD